MSIATRQHEKRLQEMLRKPNVSVFEALNKPPPPPKNKKKHKAKGGEADEDEEPVEVTPEEIDAMDWVDQKREELLEERQASRHAFVAAVDDMQLVLSRCESCGQAVAVVCGGEERRLWAHHGPV